LKTWLESSSAEAWKEHNGSHRKAVPQVSGLRKTKSGVRFLRPDTWDLRPDQLRPSRPGVNLISPGSGSPATVGADV
jgi:hypothetical protein